MSSLIVNVCKILKVEKHPNTDRLSIATVKGWNCIIGLNDYKEGDLVVFCPPDSIIPTNIIEQYQLAYLRRGRVKTAKLRGYISQGLILSIPEGKNWTEGKEVSKELGITKHEVLVSNNLQLGGRKPTKKNINPYFHKYTDIENIKNYYNIFKEGDIVIVTEKIHGTNFRAGLLKRYTDTLWGKIKSLIFGKYQFVYGSHNVQKLPFKSKGYYGEDVYGKIAKKYKLSEIIPEDYIIYGEIYGKKIQELTYGLDDIDVVFFDVKYKGEYLNWETFKEFCYSKQLPIVPILQEGRFSKELLEWATKGHSVLGYTNGNKTQIREGCVIKVLEEENNIQIGRKILKSINPEYLLKKNRTEYK